MFATALYWAMPFIDFMWYPDEQLALLDQGGLGASLPTSEAFYWFQLSLWLLISVGLLFFINIARTAFVVLYVLATISGLFYGIQVLTPVELLLANLISMGDGAIIAIMYLTSVSEAFREAS